VVAALPGIASCSRANILFERAQAHNKSWNYHNGRFYRCNFGLFRQSLQIQIITQLYLCIRKHFNHVRSVQSGHKIMIMYPFRAFVCVVVISKGLTFVNRYIKFHVWSAFQPPFRGSAMLHRIKLLRLRLRVHDWPATFGLRLAVGGLPRFLRFTDLEYDEGHQRGSGSSADLLGIFR